MEMSELFLTFLFVNLRYTFIAVLLNSNIIVSQDFQSLIPQILTEQSLLMDVKDYEDNNLIMTKNKIYSGLIPEEKGTFNQDFPNSAVFATYNSFYILNACTNNSLLGYININSLEETTIYPYSTVELTNYTCSLSYLEPYAYVAHITKYSSKKLFLYAFKILLKLEITGPVKEGSTYITEIIDPIESESFRQVSCENIQVIDDNSISYLICGYIEFNTTSYNKYSYFAMIADFDSLGFEGNQIIFESEKLLYFKIQKINSTYLRYLVGSNSFELFLSHTNNIYKINIVSNELRNGYLYSFHAYKDLFYYSNQYIFHAAQTDESNQNFNLYISNSISNNNLITIAINKPLEKVSGFYDEKNEKFIYIYQYSGIIEYFILRYKCFLNAWHIDINNSIVCYDEQKYCPSNQYYYHNDTRECVLSNCRDGYFQFNLECFKDNCPINTVKISNTHNKCESTLDFCYLDIYYKTHCDDNQNNEYYLKFNNTKIYLKNCNDSLYYFNEKTYLYQNNCLLECPIQTIFDDESGKCECIYYKNYLDLEKNYYECLNENEKCSDYNKYIIEDKKECAKNIQECTEKNYKIFNKLCVTNCPENTELVQYNCECKYNYYINNDELNCFSEEKTCEDIGYPI